MADHVERGPIRSEFDKGGERHKATFARLEANAQSKASPDLKATLGLGRGHPPALSKQRAHLLTLSLAHVP